ncbi:maleylpyruvate isomerase family mycothiol-dependent enzyme [Streptomyces longispororuber]|uniref:maleylpyruvate isomerase family mycothiol-dependent enzyme n=1 Tax=Streptomyces longispororuber TaxID=68230 RepID=UPI002109ED18|nr:maleylpyruvate isomerase family mycothiol-dependent enzyme [Streptomyces longispororuber]MCQ4211744.1 maleylpyruvate isomerase family mycothiol-dependent enzyme [Streptomyces longispororuber]
MDKTTPGFTDLLRLIDDRATAFRAAIAAAPDLDAQVPTCPGWTLRDLAQHLGERRHFWAVTVAAGPADVPPTVEPTPAPREREALLAWLADAFQRFLDALRTVGPDRACWTWWGASESPRTTGAVARHQLQEMAVHTYDAQLTAGIPQPLPYEAALDGIDEFLSTCCATTSPWPHHPAKVDFHTTDGHTWRLILSPRGAVVARPPITGVLPAASVRAPAPDLVLALHGRIPLDTLELAGDSAYFDLLAEWEPED